MELFYKIVIIVAIVILILALTYIGILLSEKKLSGTSTVGFPPVKNSCPDNWEAIVDENDSNKIYCKVPIANMKNTGTILKEKEDGTTNIENTIGYSEDVFADTPVINFDNSLWAGNGKTSDCAKKDWANTYDILWDGITNYSKCE